MYIKMTFFSRDTKKINESVPGGLDESFWALEPMVLGSIPGGGIFLKPWSIYTFKLVSSVYSTIIPNFRKFGSSGRYIYVRVEFKVSEGASVVRSQAEVEVGLLESPFFLKILGWGFGFETFSCRYFYSELKA